jgi:HSP20 family protein
MFEKKSSLAPLRSRNPFDWLYDITSEMDRAFAGWPPLRSSMTPQSSPWTPGIEVFERENHLVTRVDLPGMKKDDVSVEVTDGRLVLSGERKREIEAKKENVYRSEREYGSFYRAVPLPEGVRLEDVRAVFADGVLEVSVPLPARPQATVRKVTIEEPKKAAATTAA